MSDDRKTDAALHGLTDREKHALKVRSRAAQVHNGHCDGTPDTCEQYALALGIAGQEIDALDTLRLRDAAARRRRSSTPARCDEPAGTDRCTRDDTLEAHRSDILGGYVHTDHRAGTSWLVTPEWVSTRTQGDNVSVGAHSVEAELSVADPPCGRVGFRTRLAVERGELTEQQAVALLEQLRLGIASLQSLAVFLHDDVAREVGVRLELGNLTVGLSGAHEHAQRAIDYGRENGVLL